MEQNKAAQIKERINLVQAALKLIVKNPRPVMKITPIKLITKAENPKEPELR
jgi:hypothetical protein